MTTTTRRHCTCSDCQRSRASVVHGGPDVRCPNGHARVRLKSGRDGKGRYLLAWCSEPGCRAEQTVRRPDQQEFVL